ncbi:MAG: YcjX family protein [Alphaproteobacteria bacterium]|nr:YcjX family protein [Alphaproteobacteria bacterium]
MSLLDRTGAGLSDFLSGVPDLAELLKGSTVNLAVTGLSRSGKTVFITSLVHNLLSALHQPHRMPLLKVVGEARLVAARLAGGKPGRLPRFPYERNIERMAASPADWPDRTADISEIEIDIRFHPSGALGFLLGRVGRGAATLKLRIVDYPGEWLLDLPLLTQSYAEWSRATLQLCRRGTRGETAREFLAFLSNRRHDAAASEDDARRAHDLYRAHLLAARDRHGLSFLQPGRFLNPGSLGESTRMWFAPLDFSDDAQHGARSTLGELMEQRFELYKAEVVTPFYKQYFRDYARQVVLVDVLGALLAGREVFEDTRRAIDAILESFRYGRRSIIGRLLGSAPIEKVLFAATKADHVPEVQREHLAALLRSMVALSSLDVTGSDARIDVTALASVVSTEEDTQEIDGHRVQVVVGRPVGSDTRAKFFVGNVPARPPRPEAWGRPFLNIPVFEPPVIDASPIDGIAHMNLDLALDYLLGDRLQ